MTHARVKPNVQDVGCFLVELSFGAKQFSRIQTVPSVDTSLFHAQRNLLHQCRRMGMRLKRFLVDKNRDRHAPGALA